VGRSMLTSKEKPDTKRLPMMPIREVVIFPYMMTPFVLGRESSVRALEEAMAGDKKIFLAAQHDASVDEPKPNEIFSVGTIVNIVQSLKLPDATSRFWWRAWSAPRWFRFPMRTVFSAPSYAPRATAWRPGRNSMPW